MAYFDRGPTGSDGLAPPLQRLIQVSRFQDQNRLCALGLQVRPVGDETLPPVVRSDSRCLPEQAANENSHTSSHHLFVERVDIAAIDSGSGPVVVVGCE